MGHGSDGKYSMDWREIYSLSVVDGKNRFPHNLSQLTMPMRLRFAVHGLRNNRIFHLVATDRRRRRDGKPIELLGIYQPRIKLGEDKKVVDWSADRIRYWLHVGAVPSKSVVKLLEMGNILKPGHPYERTIVPKDKSPESSTTTETTQAA
ncbi:hypothetical protein APHAL10511_006459 [Amanita phalloides]|nr:hypothetical protein APHAL10511_006459 [Amanita phalloides]